jgi:hypothetical protein
VDYMSVGYECHILQAAAFQSVQVKAYQQGAGMMPPRADGYDRPPSPHMDRREVVPQFCTRRAGLRVGNRRKTFFPVTNRPMAPVVEHE